MRRLLLLVGVMLPLSGIKAQTPKLILSGKALYISDKTESQHINVSQPPSRHLRLLATFRQKRSQQALRKEVNGRQVLKRDVILPGKHPLRMSA